MSFDECTSCLGWEDAYEKFRAKLAGCKSSLEMAGRNGLRLLEELAAAKAENERLLAANKDCIANFEALKADYDKLLAEREERERQIPLVLQSENAIFKEDSGDFAPQHLFKLGDKLYRHPPVPAVPEWLPIETAPKDGTYILIADAQGCRTIAGWFDYAIPLCRKPTWFGLNRRAIIAFEPTRWMPLPAALQNGKERG